MYKSKPNAIQRARNRRGLTQEALAECSGYSVDSIRAWETGARIASLEALNILSDVLNTTWLTVVYLKEQTTALNDLIPEFTVGRPLAEAAADYINSILDLIDNRFDRKLLRMIADGHIDELEEADYQALLEMAGRADKAYFEIRFAQKDKED